MITTRRGSCRSGTGTTAVCSWWLRPARAPALSGLRQRHDPDRKSGRVPLQGFVSGPARRLGAHGWLSGLTLVLSASCHGWETRSHLHKLRPRREGRGPLVKRTISAVVALVVFCAAFAPAFLVRPAPAQAEPVTVTVVSVAAIMAAIAAAGATYSASPTFKAACDEMGVSAQEGYRIWLLYSAGNVGAASSSIYHRPMTQAEVVLWLGGPGGDPGWKGWKALTAFMKSRGTIAALAGMGAATQLGYWLSNMAGMYALLGAKEKGVVPPNGLLTTNWLLGKVGGAAMPGANFTPAYNMGTHTVAQLNRAARFWAACVTGQGANYPGVVSMGDPVAGMTYNNGATRQVGFSGPGLCTLTDGTTYNLGNPLGPITTSNTGATWATAGIITEASSGGFVTWFLSKETVILTGVAAPGNETALAASPTDAASFPESVAVASPAGVDPATTAYNGWQTSPATVPRVPSPYAPPTVTTPRPEVVGLETGYTTIDSWLASATAGIAGLPAPFDSVMAWVVQPIVAGLRAFQSLLQWLGQLWTWLLELPTLAYSFFDGVLHEILARIGDVVSAIANLPQSSADLLTYVQAPTAVQVQTEVAYQTARWEGLQAQLVGCWPFAVVPIVGMLVGGVTAGTFSIPMEATFQYAPERWVTISAAQLLEPIGQYRWLLVIVVWFGIGFVLFSMLRPQVEV